LADAGEALCRQRRESWGGGSSHPVVRMSNLSFRISKAPNQVSTKTIVKM
jgi:hypothetical protein